LKKIKVTKRVATKVPWYEKPPLLFGAIAGLLLISGLVMAHLNSRTAKPPVVLGPDSAGDSSVVATLPSDDLGEAQAELLTVADALPPAESGVSLPPVVLETLKDAVALRARFREARQLEAPPSAGETAADRGHYAFGPPEALLEAAAQAPAPTDLWAHMAFGAAERGPRDFEFHRDASGEAYIVAFVSREVGEALHARGPRLNLSPAPPVEAPPRWQFWRKAPEPEKLELFLESVIVLHPELSPEATCGVVLPLERLRPLRVREIRVGLTRPVDVLEVALR
jgi:hypothetical protein